MGLQPFPCGVVQGVAARGGEVVHEALRLGGGGFRVAQSAVDEPQEAFDVGRLTDVH